MLIVNASCKQAKIFNRVNGLYNACRTAANDGGRFHALAMHRQHHQPSGAILLLLLLLVYLNTKCSLSHMRFSYF
jgi:hypothetical protein